MDTRQAIRKPEIQAVLPAGGRVRVAGLKVRPLRLAGGTSGEGRERSPCVCIRRLLSCPAEGMVRLPEGSIRELRLNILKANAYAPAVGAARQSPDTHASELLSGCFVQRMRHAEAVKASSCFLSADEIAVHVHVIRKKATPPRPRRPQRFHSSRGPDP